MSEEKPIDVSTFMPIYWDDYIGGTLDFSLAEHGAYLLLMREYWDNGGPLPRTTPRIVLSRTRTSNRHVSEVLAKVLSKFTLKDDHYHHARIDAELARSRDKRLKSRQKAELAAAVRWGKEERPRTARRSATSNPRSSAPSKTLEMLGVCPPTPTPYSTNSEHPRARAGEGGKEAPAARPANTRETELETLSPKAREFYAGIFSKPDEPEPDENTKRQELTAQLEKLQKDQR